jgi:hypothetical protein
MKLSENFNLSEFQVSETAARRGIDMTVPAELVPRLRLLCENVLEPVRRHFGKPVVISSGWRPPKLNKIIGGSATSQHSLAEAADFEVPGVSNVVVAQWIARNCRFDQLILEFVTQGEPNSGWVHCSYRVGRLRSEALTARRVRKLGVRRTVYLPGLQP